MAYVVDRDGNKDGDENGDGDGDGDRNRDGDGDRDRDRGTKFGLTNLTKSGLKVQIE